MRVERSGTINRPIDRVFEYVSTPENDPTWVSVSLRHEKISPGPMRVGSITEEDGRLLGRRMRYAWEVIQHEPPTAFAHEPPPGCSPLPFASRWSPLMAALSLRSVPMLRCAASISSWSPR
jgi:hypothetical protein